MTNSVSILKCLTAGCCSEVAKAWMEGYWVKQDATYEPL